MKDDFIKRHKQPPDVQFVDQLHQKITTQGTQPRSYAVLKRIPRLALLAVLALVLVAAVTLTVSPGARAAVQAIFSFNGVDVSYDDSTGKLSASGNTGAILQQSDHEVIIRGQNGETAGVAIAKAESESLPVSVLLGQYPDLVLPTPPAAYSLDPQAQRFTDGSLVFTWTDDSGQTITFQRTQVHSVAFDSDHPATGGTDSGPGGVITDSFGITATSDSGPALQYSESVSGEAQAIAPPDSITGSLSSDSGAQAVPLAFFTWEADGYQYMLTASDTSLTQADLQAMRR